MPFDDPACFRIHRRAAGGRVWRPDAGAGQAAPRRGRQAGAQGRPGILAVVQFDLAARRRTRPMRVRPTDEWHVVLVNAFRHFAFHLGAGLGQPVVVMAPPLFQSRLVTVGPVGDPMAGDGVQQVPIQAQAACGVAGS